MMRDSCEPYERERRCVWILNPVASCRSSSALSNMFLGVCCVWPADTWTAVALQKSMDCRRSEHPGCSHNAPVQIVLWFKPQRADVFQFVCRPVWHLNDRPVLYSSLVLEPSRGFRNTLSLNKRCFCTYGFCHSEAGALENAHVRTVNQSSLLNHAQAEVKTGPLDSVFQNQVQDDLCFVKGGCGRLSSASIWISHLSYSRHWEMNGLVLL